MPNTKLLDFRSQTDFPFRAKVITPNNNADLTDYDGLPHWMTVFVGTAGDVNVQPAGNPPNTPVLFTVPEGGVVPVRVSRVLVDNTTASDLVGVF